MLNQQQKQENKLKKIFLNCLLQSVRIINKVILIIVDKLNNSVLKALSLDGTTEEENREAFINAFIIAPFVILFIGIVLIVGGV